ncbi:MAG: FkbM family methyltransferase [Patescibacteria group bacterium]
MINFSKISNKSFFGKLLRGFLTIIPNRMTVRILQGKLKGKKWIKGSGVNGYWLGSYERKQTKIFEKTVNKGDVVFDIGANVGFYSLLAAEIVGSSGKVFSFEPLPENVKFLKKHIEINNYKNIFVFDNAVSDKSGHSFFKKEDSRSLGRLSDSGKFKVEIIAIDDWIASKKLPMPNVMKIDTEGAEMNVLKGAENTLKANRPIIFLSIHSGESHKKCCGYLLSMGYKLEPIGEADMDSADEILARS